MSKTEETLPMSKNTYRTTIVFNEKLTSEEYHAQITELTNTLEKLSATHIRIEYLGLKKLVYEMKHGCKQGWIVDLNFKLDKHTVNNKWDLALRQTQNIINFIISLEDDDHHATTAKPIVDAFDLIFGIDP